MDFSGRLNNTIRSINSGSNAAHSYIIEAPQGEAREEALDSLVHGIIGDDATLSSLDVVRMSCTGKNSYLVDDAAAFIRRLSMGSYGEHIVGIIDNAELMSEVVQNKLLKTLEEPAPGTVIVLCTLSRDKLIPTVQSRCVTLKAGDEFGIARSGSDIDCESFGTEFFYQYRQAVEKKLKSQEDALILLGSMEDNLRYEMINGRNSAGCAEAIELVEHTRMDIYNGMSYGKALKKLYLQLN